MRFLKDHFFTYLTVLVTVFASVLVGSRLTETAMTAGEIDNFPPVVVIDAGHGGEDGGAVSKSGVLESELNLEIALRLNDVLHLLGQDTVMIRETDISVYSEGAVSIAQKKISDLKNRVQMVSKTPNALLVSIHQNMFQEPKYSGAQVFYAPTETSRELAEAMQARLVASVNPGNRRQAKQAETVYLMNNIRCPGILIECGFLSNPEECAKLCTAEYQKQFSIAIASGLTDYIGRTSQYEV